MSSGGYAMAEENTYDARSDERQMSKTKKKKIGFLKKWLFKSIKEASDAERENSDNVLSRELPINKQARLVSSSASIDQPDRAIHFTVYVASGGRVVETRRVDRKTDRTTSGLYIVTGDQDFGKEIDKIITMEALR